MKLYKGIDVSRAQGNIDFKKVRDAGIQFIMFRASHGAINEYPYPFKDANFDKNVINFAQTDGKFYGGSYHVLTAQTLEKAKEEARFYINALKPYKFNLQLWAVLDVEIEKVTANKTLFSAIVQTFTDMLKDAGYRPMIYSQKWYIDAYFDIPENVPVWICDINTSSFPNGARIWQAGIGKIDGINTDVDIDYAYDIMGDVNGDGKVNSRDVTAVMKHIINPKTTINESQADFNRDGKVNSRDLIELMKAVL